MGQNTSRQSRRRMSFDVPGRNSTSDGERDPAALSPSASLPPASSFAPSGEFPHRRSVRRSILNIVKPSLRNSQGNQEGTPRRSWRHSRRWSKVVPPTDNTTAERGDPPMDSVEPTTVETSQDVISEENAIPSDDPPDIASGLPAATSSNSNVPVIASSPVTAESNEVTNNEEMPANNDTVTQTTSQSNSRTPNGLNDIVPVPTSLAPRMPGLSIDGSRNAPEFTAAPPPVHLTTGQLPIFPPTPAAARQFPPPGTLVVVQGVVHTTDVPRQSLNANMSQDAQASTPRSSSSPPAFANDNARNRLSSLLRSRPASGISSQPSSIFDMPYSPSGIPSTPNSTLPDNPSNDIPPSHAPSHPELPNLGNRSTPQEPISNDNPPPGTISSNSIDVLGTLLSVAAAATAASLLSGSTEPMLPPSIGPPPYNSNPVPTRPPAPFGPTPPFLDLSRPSSPTSVNGLGPIGIDPAAARRAERLRHAWGSIRERLGLRNTPPNSATSVGGEPEPATPSSPTNDPRELVLAQMARAFNLGFGVGENPPTTPISRENGENGGSQQRQDEPAPAVGTTLREPNSPPPADGSFERFLVDLQADLRTALTNSQQSSDSGSGSSPTSEDGQRVAESSQSAAEPRGSNSEFEYQDARDTERGVDQTAVSPMPESTGQSAPTILSQLPITSDNGLPPFLTRNNRATEGQDSDVQGRINWWRLYRFPPITSRTPGVSGVPAVRAPSTVISPRGTSLNPEPPSSQETMDPTLSELPFAGPDRETEGQERTQSVVPVIVVGLQSVNSSWPQAPTPEENNADGEVLGNADDERQEEPATNNSTNPSANPVEAEAPDGSGIPPSSRGRAWHRAAEALRNLRTGRRTRAAPASAGSGSRTFLIYVIGGYYPPDHNIVTGGPNTLDSFEALLELAELLGQVKPPTVTKEDIEKSGLEIIQASKLQEYEREQKVSSNCVDRCLICLDEYQSEDEVRIMRCRHAFHMNCVDKWLETGRNNCPACRSRGVSNLS